LSCERDARPAWDAGQVAMLDKQALAIQQAVEI